MSNNMIIVLGAGFFLAVAIVVGFFLFTQIKERKRTTNLELPNIDELDKKERLERMMANREEFGFGEKSGELRVDEIGSTDEDELDPEKYIPAAKKTSVIEDFGGLLSLEGKLQTPPPQVIKNKVELPGLDEQIVASPINEELDNGETDAKSVQTDTNTNNQMDEELPETADTAETKKPLVLPEID